MWPSFDDQPSVSPSSFLHPVASFESKNDDHCQVDCSEDEYIMQSSPQLSPNQPLNPSPDPKGTSQRRYPERVRQSKCFLFQSMFPIVYFLLPILHSYLLSIPLVNLSLIVAATQKSWQDAMQEEISALEKNGTWDLVMLPQGKQVVGCKWVFKVKYLADGSVERYKARLVAKGYTQEPGIDYDETFAPVANMRSIRCVLSIAAIKEWPLYQLFVKNAFLYGDLQEEVYMSLPPGFDNSAKPNVCRFHQAIVGAPRAWFAKLSETMQTGGFRKIQGSERKFALYQKNRKRIGSCTCVCG